MQHHVWLCGVFVKALCYFIFAFHFQVSTPSQTIFVLTLYCFKGLFTGVPSRVSTIHEKRMSYTASCVPSLASLSCHFWAFSSILVAFLAVLVQQHFNCFGL